jgi:abortive infection bacteriophage resistance protein
MNPPGSPSGPLKVPYTKGHKTYDEQVDYLISRGLAIPDRAAAARFLSHVNYYRLSAYYRTFYVRPNVFATGVTFDHLRALYEFDRELRHLIGRAIETIEVSLRTGISYQIGLAYGAFGHAEPTNFWDRFVTETNPKRPSFARWYADVEKETARSKEEFVIHFQTKHLEYPKLPVWTVVELMSFGTLSIMYYGMKARDKKAVASRYAADFDILGSWIQSLTYIRNLCFHHSRLWNRTLAVAPRIPVDRNWASLPQPKSLCPALFMLKHMASKSPAPSFDVDKWKRDIETLLDKGVPGADVTSALGVPKDWKSHPLWK